MNPSITFTAEEIQLMHKIIGHNVKNIRESHGMSQKELATAMGYKSVSIVSAAEISYKNKHFNLEHLYKISKIFNIPLSELF